MRQDEEVQNRRPYPQLGTSLARVHLAGSCTIIVNDANLSQGESERSERSQIEDVTNYCSNVAQGLKVRLKHRFEGSNRYIHLVSSHELGDRPSAQGE